jgi:O-antigen ligase
MSSKWIQRYIIALTFLSFLMPLILLRHSFIFPFIVPKVVFFRSVVLLMVAGYVPLLIAYKKQLLPKASPLLIACGLWFVSMFASTVFSVDWYHSFWDNHERMLGLFTLIHFGMYACVLAAVVKGKELWNWLFTGILSSGIAVTTVGLYQYIVDPEFLLNGGATRVASTLGNPIYVSGFGLFLVFAGAMFALQNTKQWQKAFGVLASCYGIAGILVGGTRGTLLGLFIGLALLIPLYALTFRGHKRTQRTLWGITAVGVLFVVGLVAFRGHPAVQSIPGVNRLSQTTLQSRTVQTRLIAWDVAFEAFQEMPVFGWGLNNYFYAFNAYYHPESLRYGYRETWFDNAHNVFMHTLATQGAFGVLAYGFVYIAAMIALWRMYQDKKISIHVALLGVSFLVGHAVHNAVAFENPTSYLYFFFFLAYLMARQGDEEPVPYGYVSMPVSLVAVLIFGGAVLLTNVQPAKANQRALAAIRSLYGFRTDAPMLVEQAFASPSPHIDDIRLDIVRTVSEAFTGYVDRKQTNEAEQLYAVSMRAIDQNIALRPLDIRNHMQAAALLESVGNILGDHELYMAAANYLELALVQSPDRQQLKYLLSTVEFRQGNIDRAIALVQETIDAEPMIAEGYWRMAAMLADQGKGEEARTILQKAEDQGVRFTGSNAQMKDRILRTIYATSTNQ